METTSTIISKPKQVLRMYDAPDYIDRYTVILSRRAYPSYRLGTYSYIALNNSPTHPQGFSQWGEGAMPGKHLGKKIAWGDLPQNVQEHIVFRLRGE